MTRALAIGSMRSRAAALALLAGVAALIWLLVVAPVLEARAALDEELRATQALRARFDAQAAGWRAGRGHAGILSAPTAAVAAASLQARLEAIIADSGAAAERLEAMAVPPAGGTDGLEPVDVSASLTATIAQLRRILMAIENDPTTMIVDELAVRAEAPFAGPAPTAGEDALRVDLRVRAFRPKGATP